MSIYRYWVMEKVKLNYFNAIRSRCGNVGLILCLLGASLLFRWGSIYLNHVVFLFLYLYFIFFVMVVPKFIIIVESDDYKICSTFSIFILFYYKIIINFVFNPCHCLTLLPDNFGWVGSG